MMLVLFFLCAAVVVTFAVKLSDCADWFEQNTRMTGALVGFFLAAATSLPELMSGLTSVFINQEELAISSILGSNLFNYNIVAVANLAFISFLAFNKLNKNTIKILLFIVSIYVLLIVSIFISDVRGLSFFDFRISIASVLIVIIYIWSIFSLGEEEEQTHSAPKPQVRKKIMYALIFAIVLIISSSLLAKIVEQVMFDLELSASLAGSLLLGACTSLPEFVGAIALMRKRQYNVAIASVLSSNLFNFFVLFVLDFATPSNILIYFTKSTYVLIIFGLVNTVILLLALKFYKTNKKFLYSIPSVLVLAVYTVYLLNA